MDETLNECNETELLWLAYQQGLGRLRRGIERPILLAIIHGDIEPTAEHYGGTQFTRKKLELFIDNHWNQVVSQLPGCNGKCTTYPCTEGRHLLCVEANRDLI